jgi:serine/threonine-protein kinase
MTRRARASALLVALLALAPAVGAQPAVSGEAVAETLFREATTLIQEGKYAEACPKLEASHRADPAGGTVLLLAICYEQTGRTASAWLRFNEARAMARADRRQDREARATEHLAALEPRLSFVTVVVVGSERELPASRWRSTAPRCRSSTRALPSARPRRARRSGDGRGQARVAGSVVVAGEGERLRVEIPPLLELPPPGPPGAGDRAPVAPAPPSGPSTVDRRPERTPGTTQRRLSLGVGLVGLAATGAGAYFGVVALDRREESEKLCPELACTDAQGAALNAEAFTNADRANVLIGGGVGLLVAATVLHVTAPHRRRHDAPVAFTPALGASGSACAATSDPRLTRRDRSPRPRGP